VNTTQLIERYYACFNAQDVDGMIALLTENIIHDVSQGEPRVGRDTFKQFLEHMNRCYRERVHDLCVMVNADGSRSAAEFMLDGTYLQTDDGLPEAHGQTYRLRVGAFFELQDGLIARVSNHYNLADWINQVRT
jgi:steroid delta-isomerase-like uncharacterized protein